MNDLTQARRTFQGQWINTLLANFESNYETQQVALATLWSILETGFIRKSSILKVLGYCPDEPVPEAIAALLQLVAREIARLEIPTSYGNLKLIMKGAKYYEFNRNLAEWENELVNDIADAFVTHFPSPVPVPATEKQYIDGTWVIKHTVAKFKDQSVRTAPLAFEALNALNSQGYRLNPDMLNITNLLEDQAKPTGASALHRLNRLRTIKRFTGKFYFKYTFDFRGRIYARSAVITPQGDSFSKACLNLDTTKALGRGGVQALAIHYANQSGMDKASYVQRIKWAMNDGMILAGQLVKAKGNWMIINPLLNEADNFEQYTAAMDWYRAMTSPDPTKYESSVICHQDATNSGFQFGAALLKDSIAAEFVNITSTKTAHDMPADLYGEMALKLLSLLKDKPEWHAYINRKFCKKPIMITGYGAGEAKVTEQVIAFMEDSKNGIPTALDFEDIKSEFFIALEETVGSMTHITKSMKEHAQQLMEVSEVISWVTPDGFRVHHQYRDTSARKVEVNGLHALRKKRKGEVDPLADQMIGALPPNFIHSIDGAMLRTAALKAKQQDIAFCPIHDSFGTHAADYWPLHGILKAAFVETMQYDWYTAFCNANEIRPTLETMGDYDVNDAAKAAYMFS